jgi:hypothetical protein
MWKGHDRPVSGQYHERKGCSMNKDFVDLDYMRQAIEDEALKVKTGVRAGEYDPPYICYGVEPPPDDGPIYA